MDDVIAAKIHERFSRYPKRVYPKGQILVFANENPEHIFYIIKGRVRKYDVSYRGDEVAINVFKSPAFFPMSWALNQTPNKYFYKTETETELHIVPTNEAYTFLVENPDVTLDLLSRVYTGLEGMYGRLVYLMSGTARSRIIYELLIECRRFGEQQPDSSYLLSTTETDMATHSGLSRETVSREVAKLKDAGWLASKGKRLVITNLSELEHALGGEV